MLYKNRSSQLTITISADLFLLLWATTGRTGRASQDIRLQAQIEGIHGSSEDIEAFGSDQIVTNTTSDIN